MKYCIIGDFHLTNHIPVCRLDNYPEAQKKKLEWIFNYCVDNMIERIISVGDFLDKAQFPLHFISETVDLFKPLKTYIANIPFYSVIGNHDSSFHSVLSNNSVFGVLKKAGFIKTEPPIDSNCVFHFVHYQEPIPEPIKDKFNVLIIHTGISEKPLHFDTKERWHTAKDFLKDYGFQLVFSGHNHKRFKESYRTGSRRLYNCGSVCRSSVDQFDHEPYIYIFDSDTREVEEIPVPITDASLVINKEAHDNKKEIDMKIASFVEGFGNQENISLDFLSNLWHSPSVVGADEKVKEIIQICVE